MIHFFLKLNLGLILLLNAFSIVAQISDLGDSSEAKPTPQESMEIDPKNFIEPEEQTEAKIYSKTEVDKVCAKYENRYVSYAAKLYLVEACKLREVSNSDFQFELTKRGVKISEVDADVIAKIPAGEEITVASFKNKKVRKCAELKNRYISFSYTDIYYVDNSCKKYLIPDYETYMVHKKKNKHSNKGSDVDAVLWVEFASLESGKSIPSVLDKEFANTVDAKRGVDLIPIDEACKGLNGKLVSFHSKAYKIEKCQKVEIDLEKEMLKFKSKELKPIELSPEQWLSIPDAQLSKK